MLVGMLRSLIEISLKMGNQLRRRLLTGVARLLLSLLLLLLLLLHSHYLSHTLLLVQRELL